MNWKLLLFILNLVIFIAFILTRLLLNVFTFIMTLSIKYAQLYHTDD